MDLEWNETIEIGICRPTKSLLFCIW